MTTPTPGPSPRPRTGGQVLVDGLLAQGVTDVFCVPGESYLAALDAFRDAAVRVTVCRQEGGAAMMAEAHGKLTGRPGVCFVTRAPGATNASAGLHVAEHDSTPMILLIGQVEGAMRGRGAFQEMDYERVFGPCAKWVHEVREAERLPELIARAFRTAMQGRPGPVVLAFPEEVLRDVVTVADAPHVEPAETWPGLPQMADLQKLLWAARSPIVIAGGARWSDKAVAALVRFAERFDLPVATSFRRAGLFPGDHPNHAGEIGIGPDPRLRARIEAADLVLLLGGRMAEMPSQSYALFGAPDPGRLLVHVHAGAEELGRVYQPHLAVHASPNAFCASLEGLQPPNAIPWRAATREAREQRLDWTGQVPAIPGALQMGEAMRWLAAHLAPEAIVTSGAGNFSIWPGRFLPTRRRDGQLASTSGSMGYGLPAAVAAARLQPGRRVVCFAGDGDFLMTGQEFATLVQYDLPVIVVVIDNGMYGTIRMHQEREYPGRVSATALKNPDFAALARAYGGFGERVETTADFAPAFERAEASGKPAILHLLIDPEAITPSVTLTGLREAALARGAAPARGA